MAISLLSDLFFLKRCFWSIFLKIEFSIYLFIL